MSAPKLYGSYFSTCTGRVLFTAAVGHFPYEFVPLNMAAGEHRSPEHLARQPFGKVPALVDQDFTLFESRAICRYLVEKNGGNQQLLPTDLKSRAIFEQWAMVEVQQLSNYLEQIMYHTVWYQYKGAQRDDVAAQKARDALKPALTILDKQLEGKQFILGDSLSLIDIWLTPTIAVLPEDEFKLLIESHPNIAAWWKRVVNHPGWQQVQAAKRQQ